MQLWFCTTANITAAFTGPGPAQRVNKGAVLLLLNIGRQIDKKMRVQIKHHFLDLEQVPYITSVIGSYQ